MVASNAEAAFKEAAALKERGNGRLKARDLAGALRCYSEGLALLAAAVAAGDGGSDASARGAGAAAGCDCRGLAVALHANSAQVLIRQRKWLECIEQCNAALRLDPSHAKAAWRGATAAIEVGMHDVAVSFVENALAYQPSCTDLLELRKRLGPLPDRGYEGYASGSDDEDTIVIDRWAAAGPRPGEQPPPRRPPPPKGKDKAD